jgi:dihydroorotate dehydrogenase (fumarate)
MDLKTTYLGLELKNPVIVSASSLTDSIANIKKIEEYGAGAVVLKSIFEEQILTDIDAKIEPDSMYFWYPEAAEYVKSISKPHGVEEYASMIREAKDNVSIPVIASINCIHGKEWVSFTKKIEEAGADAIELNVSTLIPEDIDLDCRLVEGTITELVANVKKACNLPVAVKIGNYYTNLIKLAKNLSDAGADGLILFNRYFKPDIDIDDEAVVTNNYLSQPAEIAESLRWIGILSTHDIKCSLAASTGIHDHTGVIKQLMAGASVTQICSTLYNNGLVYLKEIISGLEGWMEKNNYGSVDQVRGKLSKDKANTAAFERVQFMKKNMS